MSERMVTGAGVTLAADDAGEGPAVVLLHGLTATRRYVVMGSRLLERSGHRVIAYDARGHGRSSPAPEPERYGYDALTADLHAALDDLGIDRAVFAGVSMGAHTVVRFALEHPERTAGLVVITPAYDPSRAESEDRLQWWDGLAEGLRRGGVEGFVAAYGEPRVRPGWRDTVIKVIRQRLSLHERLDAVADALQVVPRSRPFESLSELRAISVPAAVVASSDEADPEHPQAVGEAYAAVLPDAQLILDEPGHSPVAWQGSQLSKVIAGVAERAFG